MSNILENYTKWISDFNEAQFDIVVENYIRNVWKIEEMSYTDGTNDGGNDIRIFLDNKKLKVQIQVTIQEGGLDAKIEKELRNLKENINKYGYQNILHFFYSHPISEEKINYYELFSSEKYNINLKIYDAKRIAAATKIYPEITRIIRQQYGLEDISSTNLSPDDRMLFDFISFGSSTAEIKGQIIRAFIVHKVYEHSKISKPKLIAECKQHFNTVDNRIFENEIRSMLRGDILIEDVGQHLKLSNQEESRIDILKEEFNTQDQKLRSDIRDLLAQHSIDNSKENDIVSFLRILFESNFNIDKQEILDNTADIETDKSTEALFVFYDNIRKITANENVKEIAKSLIEICKDNDIIQRLSAGKIFTSFTNPEVISNYVRQTERFVFLDTPIILYILCNYYLDTDYENPYYDTVKDLINFRSRHASLKYKVFKPHLNEIAYHIKEALYLIPFEENGFIEDLGGSKNVFYNFYRYLRKYNELDEEIITFGDFLSDFFEVRERDVFSKHYNSKVVAKISESLSVFNIEIIENGIKSDYYDIAHDAILSQLEEKDKTRARETINNDAALLCLLFSDEVSDNEPILVTWDLIMLGARKKFHEALTTSRLWHWFSPNRFMNHFSLVQFDIGAEKITREIISIIDENFNFYKKTQSLIDTISKLLNVKTETGKKYLEAIKSFKRDYIYEIKSQPKNEIINEDKSAYPVEDFILQLTKHYYFGNQKYKVDDFKQVFLIDDLYDNVINYFRNQLKHYVVHKKKSDNAFIEMNELIDNAKKIISESKIN